MASKGQPRVTIPTNPNELIKLAESVLKKQAADCAANPLNVLPMDSLSTKVSSADDKNQKVIQLRKDAETLMQDRDKLLGIASDQKSMTPGTATFCSTQSGMCYSVCIKDRNRSWVIGALL